MEIFEWFYEGIAPKPTGRTRSVPPYEAAKLRRSQPGTLRIWFAVGVCAALVVIGWGLLLAGVLYVVSDFSMATWLLTALGLAAGHVALAGLCWHYAANAWRRSAVAPRLTDRKLIRSRERRHVQADGR